jgi:nicotinic acid phosphoribosyltransferase
MSKLEETLNAMSIEELRARVKTLKANEEHYRKLRQQSENILRKMELNIYIIEKGLVI